jgi:hypothetical protein
MGIRPRLHPRSIRLIVPLGSAGAAALRARSVSGETSIRSIVLEALAGAGLVPKEEVEALIAGRHTGAGRRRQKADDYEISVDLPLAAIERLRETAQRRGVSLNYLVRAALAKHAIPIGADELVADRRKRGSRTPRSHYAARAPKRS